MKRVLSALFILGAAPALGEAIAVTAEPIARFEGAGIGEPVQRLVFLGGLKLTSPAENFGGFSGLGFDGDRLVMVSDRGHFLAGRLGYGDNGAPLGILDADLAPIDISGGAGAPRGYARDAEALAMVERDGRAAAVRVVFERDTRVADVDLVGGVPRGAARAVAIPDWLRRTRGNKSLEAACIAPPASPIAGSTLLVTEQADEDGAHAAWLLGNFDRGPLTYRSGASADPTDCAFLPNGDLLVLERGVLLLSFVARLVRIDADKVRPGAELTGEVIYQGVGGDLDNMEGVAVHAYPNGEPRIVLISDNNFNNWQRSLLLEFALGR